ncbi:hypothetical protein BJX99DRAFT_267547 [Aspergillus californicus]
MTKGVGRGLISATGLLDLGTNAPRVLDLCMAPGGFSATVKQDLRKARIDGLSLPTGLGGLQVMAHSVVREIVFEDITMFVAEMGMEDKIPENHPDLKKFNPSRPFLEEKYDLIFCGGGVSKLQTRAEYREGCEGERLKLAQLVFAFNRLKSGGSLVLLLHKIEYWQTAQLFYVFSKFADIQVFKPTTSHGIKSSFYMVAKNINLDADVATSALSYWRDKWAYLTFHEFTDIQEPRVEKVEGDPDVVRELIETFGDQFLGLALPVWEAQFNALRASTWIMGNSNVSMGL